MNTKRSARLAPHIVASTKVSANVLPIEGMTLLTFLGSGTNTRPFYGSAPNFQRYEFSAKHHTKNVLNSDVATLLAMKENNKPLFVQAKVEKPVQAKPVKSVKTAKTVLVVPTVAKQEEVVVNKEVAPAPKKRKKKTDA